MRSAILPAFALILAAQESHFETRSQVVLVPVRVTDASGHVVDGLSTEDFQLLDSGRPQKVSVDTIATGVAPIALAVAVQSSGISNAVLDKVRKTGRMIRPLIIGERGCAAVISFADQVRVTQECTNDGDKIETAFHRLTTGSQRQGRMIDAVLAAVRLLGSKAGSRKVLLLISESKDRGSESNLATATAAAQKAGITVYAITYSAFSTAFTSKDAPTPAGPRNPVTAVPNPSETQDGRPQTRWNPRIISPEQSMDANAAFSELMRLHKANAAQALIAGTGGARLPFTRQKGLEDALITLGEELNSQYVLSFVPEQSAAGYHLLDVRLTGSRGFRVRARPGYWLGETR